MKSSQQTGFSVFNATNADNAWNNLNSILLSITDKHAPITERRVKAQNVPWMNNTVLEAI